jgi:serine/threonine protein kinase
LIDDEGHARLADFGLITISETQNFNITLSLAGDKGSSRWMAPELFGGGVRKSRASDIYAFGMTILEVRVASCIPDRRYVELH